MKMKIKRKIKMKIKKFVFTRSLNLGGINLSVKPGDQISFNGKNYICGNIKYDNTRDFDIAIKNGWLVDAKSYDIQQKLNAKKDYQFKFGIVKQQEEKSIPIAKVINEQQGFIEDSGVIKPLDKGIHVADTQKLVTSITEFQKKIAGQQNTEDDDVAKIIAEQQKQIKENKIKTKKIVAKQPKVQKVKKEIVKTSKTSKTAQKKTAKKQKKTSKSKNVGTVRGMKIIKGQQ